MTLKEILEKMNIWEISIGSHSSRTSEFAPPVKTRPEDRERIVDVYGDCEVDSITNVCKRELVIWIK